MLRSQKPPGFSGIHIDPTDVDAMIPKALRKMEETKSARDIAKNSGFSVNRLKKAWAVCIALLCFVSAARASDLNAGYSFTVNDQVTATKLNALAGSATINTSFFTDKSAGTPAGADTFLFYSSSLAGYRKATLNSLLLQNTDLITTQTEDTAPAYGDFVLTYDASASGLKKATLGNILTNLVFGNTSLILTGPEITTPFIADFLPLSQGGTNNKITLSNLWLTMPFGITTFTNLQAHTSPTNLDKLLIWSSVGGSNRQTTLIGLITNAPNMPTTDYTNMGNVTFPVAYINDAGTATVYKKLPILTLVAYLTIGTAAFATPAQLPSKFATAEIGVTNGVNTVSVTHGLSGAPQLTRWVLVCKTNEIGYVAGDEVDVSAAVDTGSANTHISYGANSTEIWLSVNVAGSLRLNNRTNGAITTLTPVVSTVVQNWKLKGYCTLLNY